MEKLYLALVINVITYSFCFGQGTVRGKITDENGEPAIAATIVLKSNRTIAASTNFDGNYTLKLPDSTAQILIVSYLGYKTMEEPVRVSNGQVFIKNFSMKPEATEMKEVEVVGKANKAKEYYMEKVKINSVTTMDYISAETMKKTGDANVTAAVARVSGVSTTSAGFITVRGIGDRYVKTTVNKSRIPTLDPYTNNIKLDLFPASLVDNIILVKTASPDLPGDWAGAYISVETKDYPEKFMLNIETSLGYNNQSTFKDVLTSQRSSTDWLGYDKDFRDKNHSEFISANMEPTKYQEFVALGLRDYYNSLGITENTPWNYTYYKLGLVQLGILAPAMFNVPAAVTAAENTYENGFYHANAFSAVNANVSASSKSFPNNWDITYRKAPLNFSQSFSIGNQVKLAGNPFGFIAGFRYGSSVMYDPNASVNRTDILNLSTPTAISTEQSSKEGNGWSALANASYKFSPNNSISLLFMPNYTGVNNVRYTTTDVKIPALELNKQQFYEERRQLVYQFKSENYIPGPKIKTQLSASYTNGTSSVPDFKRLVYGYDQSTDAYSIGGGSAFSDRSYRYLSDNVFDSHFNAELLTWNKPGLTRKLIMGGSYQENHKKSDQYQYTIYNGPYAALKFNGDFEAYYDHSKFEMTSGINHNGVPYNTFDFYYKIIDKPTNHMFGYSKIKSGFIMTDYALIPALRFSGGLRVEQADTYTDAVKYDSLGYDPDDPRRFEGGSGFATRTGVLNERSYLPSASLIYKLKKDETAPVNLRFNYSQTVARPSIRELAEVTTYDYELRVDVYGRADLKMTRVYNYDFRFESYFKSGDNISLSLFYKNVKDNIEISDAVNGYSWQNVDTSFVTGIELEGRKALFKNVELRSNITLVESRTSYINMAPMIENGTKTYKSGEHITRAMFNQAPYVVNGILAYKADSLGLNLTLSYNVQGPRLVITNSDVRLNIYELPRHLLDFKVSKTIGKHFSASVTVRDILNSPIRRAYNLDEGWVVDYDKYTYGTNYVMGISYKL